MSFKVSFFTTDSMLVVVTTLPIPNATTNGIVLTTIKGCLLKNEFAGIDRLQMLFVRILHFEMIF